MRKIRKEEQDQVKNKQKLTETKNGSWIPQFKTQNRRRS